MTLKVEIEFCGMGYFTIYHSSSRAIATFVTISFIYRKETNVMAFPNDDNRDLWIDPKFSTSL